MKFLTPLLFLTVFLSANADQHGVPFGDKVDATIVNYNRTTPAIATAGELKEGAIPKLARLGFSSIVDLRTPPEGVEEEKVETLGNNLRYINIPVGKAPPSRAQIDQFRDWIDDPANRPVIVHCASANRVGTLWAMYRLTEGISLAEALMEGRTIGMKPEREDQVRTFAGNLSAN